MHIANKLLPYCLAWQEMPMKAVIGTTEASMFSLRWDNTRRVIKKTKHKRPDFGRQMWCMT